ncbi:hypothetical protein [Mesorhizobium silamurunense]|uniref:hypothetical protein n=1 Tax=Mesorhizobium silamurunense TaxID=499528 RepID=UPI00177E3C99|nr:hypothetical protein [Mesorhizobium silamurunense]
MVSLSRAQLYDLVWAKPMTQIARELGVRDQHIARACDVYNIARPRNGHWQKIEHGKAVQTKALSTDRFGADEIVVIGQAPGEHLPESKLLGVPHADQLGGSTDARSG